MGYSVLQQQNFNSRELVEILNSKEIFTLFHKPEVKKIIMGTMGLFLCYKAIMSYPSSCINREFAGAEL